MKNLILILSLVLLTLSELRSKEFDKTIDDLWTEWKSKYGKHYESVEVEEKRRAVWEKWMNRIKQHNEHHASGLKKFSMSMNQFSDMDDDEIRSNLELLSKRKENKFLETSVYQIDSDVPIPSKFDWRKFDVATEVHSQGNCEASYAFSIVGAVEAQMKIRKLNPENLSVQQIIDCSENYGNLGCRGGSLRETLNYILDNELETETQYPYTGKDNQCKYDSQYTVTQSGEPITVPDSMSLKSAIFKHGPFAAEIAVDEEFFSYKNGTYVCPKDPDSSLLYSVLIVGYSTKDNEEYWIIQNSHGLDWGDKGYGRYNFTCPYYNITDNAISPFLIKTNKMNAGNKNK